MHFAVTWVKALYSLYQITKWLSVGPNEVYSVGLGHNYLLDNIKLHFYN